MRIAFYSPQTSHLKPGLHRGGDPIFLNSLFAEMGRRGHEIEVISNLNTRQLWKGEVPIRSVVSEALAVRRRLKEFGPDAWLVYNPSGSHPDLFGWWQRPRRYVLLAASRHQSKRMPRRWRSFLRWSHRKSLQRADVVTAARPPTLNRLLGHGVPRERLRLLPPAVPIWPAPLQEEARRRLGLPIETPIVLCATRFTRPGSGQAKTEMVLDLLSVVPSLPPDVLIVIAGDGPGRPRIEQEIRTLGIGERIRLTGAVENADVKWLYAACDVYTYPYPHDIPSVSVLEAQACGRPVVTMRGGSSELTVDDGRSGLLAEDLEDFGAQLRELTGNRERSRRMGEAGREYIASRHTMAVRADQIERMLEPSQ